MCDFKPGDEVVRISFGDAPFASDWPHDPCADRVGVTATVSGVFEASPGVYGLFLQEFWTDAPGGFAAIAWRKVQRRNSSLTIEAFMTMPGGFEEPRRAPAKKRERV